MPKLAEEIHQTKPFRTSEEEVFLNILRTSERLQAACQRRMKVIGLTMTQYNVLRILRGAGEQGLTCKAIGALMVSADPDITRLLARLQKQKLIRQQRSPEDGRAVLSYISAKGLELLAELDPIVDEANRNLLGHLTAEEQSKLIHLLERARESTCPKAAAALEAEAS